MLHILQLVAYCIDSVGGGKKTAARHMSDTTTQVSTSSAPDDCLAQAAQSGL